MKQLSILFLAVITALGTSLSAASPDNAFRQYWYAGKAELTRYALEQARYGEIHKGDAVLVFVTEPFLIDKQVKYEFGDNSKAVSVLKLNLVKKFFTGIYPYSVMTSVFSPVDYLRYRTLKVTTSSQEWCGHTFAQLNFVNNKYQTRVHSYFQDEEEQNMNLPAGWLEDEIWTRIRLAPKTLPEGQLEMIPSTQFSRLWHARLQSQKVTAQLGTINDEKLSKKSLSVYRLEYKELPRKLTIIFEKEFPHTIVAWEENHPGGFGSSPWMTTKAIRTNSLILDYWNKHGNKDAFYRDKLGLSMK